MILSSRGLSGAARGALGGTWALPEPLMGAEFLDALGSLLGALGRSWDPPGRSMALLGHFSAEMHNCWIQLGPTWAHSTLFGFIFGAIWE